MELLEIIRESWRFTGLNPRAIVETNAFGNVLIEAVDGRYWRICPEELSCQPVASSAEDFERLRSSPEFKDDWGMHRLVDIAHSLFGTPPSGRCFCLKIPAILGGAYAMPNLATITVSELLAVSGAIAAQIKDLPPGARVKLKVVD